MMEHHPAEALITIPITCIVQSIQLGMILSSDLALCSPSMHDDASMHQMTR